MFSRYYIRGPYLSVSMLKGAWPVWYFCTRMVLVIDNDAQFLYKAEGALRAAGHKVLVALSGSQALALMGTVGTEVHLIMVDLDLPNVSGFEVIQQMRGGFPDIPVIAFSGVMQNEMLEVAKYLGAKTALRKPITPEWMDAISQAREPRSVA